jgi:putative salt-induced outer membrane protein
VTHGLVKMAGLLVGAALSGSVLAQVKTDGLWRGAGAAALSINSGNTESSALQLNADMARATDSDKITLGGMINYAKNKTAGVSETTANKWAASGQYDYNLNPQVYAFGKLGLEGDRLIDLKLRTSVAVGPGYHVIATPENTFDVFGGLAYITDKYRVPQTIGDDTDTRFSRTSVLLGEETSHRLTQTTTLKQRLEVYPGLSGDKAVLVKLNAGLAVAINSTLNLTVGLVDTYNNKPPEGLKKNDVALLTGINVKLGAL